MRKPAPQQKQQQRRPSSSSGFTAALAAAGAAGSGGGSGGAAGAAGGDEAVADAAGNLTEWLDKDEQEALEATQAAVRQAQAQVRPGDG